MVAIPISQQEFRHELFDEIILSLMSKNSSMSVAKTITWPLATRARNHIHMSAKSLPTLRRKPTRSENKDSVASFESHCTYWLILDGQSICIDSTSNSAAESTHATPMSSGYLFLYIQKGYKRSAIRCRTLRGSATAASWSTFQQASSCTQKGKSLQCLTIFIPKQSVHFDQKSSSLKKLSVRASETTSKSKGYSQSS